MSSRAFTVRYFGERLDEEPPYGSEPAEVIRYTGTDTVFFDNSMNPLEVKHSLINHDGYPSNIYVKKARRTR